MAVGYLLPLFVASYVMWYRGDDFWQFGRNLVETLATPQMGEVVNLPYVSIVCVVAVIAVLIWGGIYAIVRPDKMFLLARVRRALYIFLWVAFLSMAMLLLPSCSLSACAIIAVPVAILLSFVLSVLPNNHSTLAYWMLLILFIIHLFIE